jgi:hypothetical protein
MEILLVYTCEISLFIFFYVNKSIANRRNILIYKQMIGMINIKYFYLLITRLFIV